MTSIRVHGTAACGEMCVNKYLLLGKDLLVTFPYPGQITKAGVCQQGCLINVISARVISLSPFWTPASRHIKHV
jgi:hypothetical protein